MLIAFLSVLAIGFSSLTIGALIARRFTRSPLVTVIMQTITAFVLSAGPYVYSSKLGLPFLLVVTLLPATGNAVSMLRQLWYKRQALSGTYGKSTKWAAELVNEGDREFEVAATSLSDDDRLEIGVVAESKDELRELVIDRHEQADREPIPEDFVK